MSLELSIFIFKIGLHTKYAHIVGKCKIYLNELQKQVAKIAFGRLFCPFPEREQILYFQLKKKYSAL